MSRGMHDWLEWYYDHPVEERATGRLYMTPEEFADLRAFADENGLPWPNEGDPLLFGCAIWTDPVESTKEGS